MLLPTIHSSGDDTTAPPIILIHGFLSSARTDFVETGWLPRLSLLGRRAMAIDLPAHGTSPIKNKAARSTEALPTAAIVAAIAETIARFYPGEQVDVVGYSLGARLAWELPAAGVPVHRLVLGGLSLMDPFASVHVPTLMRALEGDSVSELTGMVAGMILGSGGDPYALSSLVAGLGKQPFDSSKNVPPVPVLLAGGTDDPMVQGLSDLARALPYAEYAAVPGDHESALSSREFWEATIRRLA